MTFIFWNSCMGIHWTLRFSMMRCGPLLTNAGQNDILQKLPKFLRKCGEQLVMQKLWESYRKKFSYAADLEWNIIMGAVRSLYALSEKESSL